MNSPMNRVVARRLTLTVLMISLFSLTALTNSKWQDDEEDSTRRLWNKKFLEARARPKRPNASPPAQGQTPAATSQPAVKSPAVQPGEQPGLSGAETSEAL